MKEQVLHLDPHDDFVSARDKMGWVQTQRVVLVWPPQGPQPLDRRLDLVLLHRHAHRLGAQLALVTVSGPIRELALEIGLPVFPTLEATRRMRWRSRVPRVPPERHRARPDVDAIRRARAPRPKRLPTWAAPAGRAAAFLAGLAALAILASGLIPAASVVLTPSRQALTVAATLAAHPDLPAVDTAAGLIPARRIQVEVQATQFEPTTGSVAVPDAPAAGQVVFTNLAGTAAAVPAGLGVRTTAGASVRFVTAAAGVLEARPGAILAVPIRAADPGPAGNVAAGLINAIDGPLGTQLAVTNPLPTQGGTLMVRSAVAPEDRTRLRAAVGAQLQDAARAAIAAQVQPGEVLAGTTVTFTRVLAESFDRAVGEPADGLNLTLRLAAAGWAVREADAQAIANARLSGQVPPGQVLAAGAPRFSPLEDLGTDSAGRLRMSLTAAADIQPAIDVDQARRLILGRPLPAAVQALQASLPLAAPPDIRLWPDAYARWLPILPWLWLRVDVRTVE